MMNIRLFIIIMLFSLPIPLLRIVSIFNFMTISRFFTVENMTGDTNEILHSGTSIHWDIPLIREKQKVNKSLLTTNVITYIHNSNCFIFSILINMYIHFLKGVFVQNLINRVENRKMANVENQNAL
jgi:hypothetical protein